MERYRLYWHDHPMESLIPKSYEKERNNSFWVYEKLITLQGPN